VASPSGKSSYRRVTRRELLKLAPVAALGAFAVPALQPTLLNRGLAFTDWAAAGWFSTSRPAPTFPDSEVTPLDRFPLNSYADDDPGVDLEAWTLQVDGLVARPGRYTLQQIHALPKIRESTRHICVEGWDVIGSFGGARLKDVLMLVGADATARFLAFECADDYYESLDMATALQRMIDANWAVYRFCPGNMSWSSTSRPRRRLV